MEDKIKDLYYQNQYHRFDFFETPLDFIRENWNEKYLKLSDYGITKDEVNSYETIIREERLRVNHKEKVYSNRITAASIAYGIFEFFFFWWSIGYFNDFMKSINLFEDIVLYPCYIAYIYFLVKIAYPYGVFAMQSYRFILLQTIKYPSSYRVGFDRNKSYIRLPYLVNEHINRYFDDLLWIIHLKRLKQEIAPYYDAKPQNWDQETEKDIKAYWDELENYNKNIEER